MFQTAFFVGSFFLMVTKGSVSDTTECCCCHVDDLNDISRSWTNENNCVEPFQCCDIPSKDECEVQLNPTFDGSCGHMNEGKYQQQNNGTSSQVIYRSGVNGELKGWLGQRLYDVNLNVIEEWCIDNGRKDSFFLWRFVHCNGDYPNWFARCVFPRATNVLLYKGCNDDSFGRTIPNCFGELEEMNVGLGDDNGHDVDYRYDVENETLFVWCTNSTMPRDPNYNVQYEGKAPAKDDGIVPFYLSQCRETYNNNNNDDNRLLRDYRSNSNNQEKKEMSSLTFRMNITSNKLNNGFLEIIIAGNNMPVGYESVIQYNDSISFKVLNKQDILINGLYMNSINSLDWAYNIDKEQYITFTFINKEKQIVLDYDTNIELFIVQFTDVNETLSNISQKIHIGWIARSNHKNGTFVGFGKLVL